MAGDSTNSEVTPLKAATARAAEGSRAENGVEARSVAVEAVAAAKDAEEEEIVEDKHESASVVAPNYGTTKHEGKKGAKLKEESTDVEKQAAEPALELPPLRRTPHSFLEDLRNLSDGSVPESIVVALAVGVVCGVVAFLYYQILYFLLDYLWEDLPDSLILDTWAEPFRVLWIPFLGFIMAVLVGLSVVYLGEPGDLAYTIKCVHEQAYISMSHVAPMVAASQFSILGGGSLGPEAPLVAICAALGGFVSRRIFHKESRNVVRKHTLMGMAGALAAFFGCPLGGSLFALEVNSRFGVEYFEHALEAIFCGEICLIVFRTLAGLPIAPIWSIQAEKLGAADASTVAYGAIIGLLGGAVAACFAKFHGVIMAMFSKLGLLDNKRAVKRACLGGVVVVALGMIIPHTMFWGEEEFQVISTMAPANQLPHVWPTSGLFGFEMNSFFACVIVAVAKLIAISFTVAGGYRGGFIFPFFAAGAALGRAFTILFPSVPVPLACLCFAAGINVAITRTALATTLILAFLANEQNTMSGVLAASLVSLFATSYMPFIKSQVARIDLEHSLYVYEQPAVEEEGQEHH